MEWRVLLAGPHDFEVSQMNRDAGRRGVGRGRMSKGMLHEIDGERAHARGGEGRKDWEGGLGVEGSELA